MLILVTIGGVAYGAVASLANGAPPEWSALSKVTGLGWSWMALGMVAAVVAASARTRAALLVLVGGIAGYYAVDLLRGVYTDADLDGLPPSTDPAEAPQITSWDALGYDVALWTVAAALVCWPLARIGAKLRDDDVAGLFARLVIPVAAAAEYLLLRLPGELSAQPYSVTVATYVVGGTAGLCVAAMLIARERVPTATRD